MRSQSYHDNKSTFDALEALIESHILCRLRDKFGGEPTVEVTRGGKTTRRAIIEEDAAYLAAVQIFGQYDMSFTAKEHNSNLKLLLKAATALKKARVSLIALPEDVTDNVDSWTARTVGEEIPNHPRIATLIEALKSCVEDLEYTHQRQSGFKLPKTDFRAVALVKECRDQWEELLLEDAPDPGIRRETISSDDTESEDEIVLVRGGPFGRFLCDIFELFELEPVKAQSAWDNLRSKQKK